MKEKITLVFATNNAHKVKEVASQVPSTIAVLSLKDIGCDEDIPETSPTIAGNALQKARYIKQHYGYDCFADDTGLEVDALQGAPGVYSARYAGPEKDDRANLQKLLRDLQGNVNRQARFKTVIALSVGNQEFCFTGICEGSILNEERGKEGFGYDPVFQPNGRTRTFAEMNLNEKSRISHRGRATRQLLDFLAKKLNTFNPK